MAGSDNDHAGRGADWLGLWFGPEVTEPVRLHVAAKRYLCGTDPGYHALLSPASRYTLSVQGGPMGAEEARRFAAGPFAGQAVRVRRWDDHAKQPGVGHEGLGHFLPLLRELDRAGQPAGSPPDLFPAGGRANANGPTRPAGAGSRRQEYAISPVIRPVLFMKSRSVAQGSAFLAPGKDARAEAGRPRGGTGPQAAGRSLQLAGDDARAPACLGRV
jgi:hypothetical protein